MPPSHVGDAFLAALRAALGSTSSLLPLHEPDLGGAEGAYVKACIETGWVSSVGQYVDEFEARLAEYTGSRHVVVVSSGTAALHIALKLAGVERDDEVFVPALSFVATANAVAHCDAVPHFVDSCEETLGLDPAALDEHVERIGERTSGGLRNRQTGRRIAAVVPMHAFGHPVAMDPLIEVAERHGIVVVEDAAESLGSLYKGQHTGTFGQFGTLSFNGNKIVTTGGGGAILTDDPELARQAKHLTTTAKRPHRWEFVHDQVAWNYRLPNLNAALGCAQMERLPDMLSRKRVLAAKYRLEFAAIQHLLMVDEPEHCSSNHWLNTVRMTSPGRSELEALLELANDAGYGCRPAWALLHRLPMYDCAPRAEMPVAEALEVSLINLPSSARLGSSEDEQGE